MTGAVDCLTCRKLRGEILPPGGILYADEWVIASHAFIPPASSTVYPGWLVVELRRHVVGLGEMSAAEAQALGLALQRLSQALQKASGAERVYALVSGQAVEHLHVHLLPRYAGTPPEIGITALADWPGGRRGDENEITALCERLRQTLAQAQPVRGAAELPALPKREGSPLLQAYFELYRLKRLYRQGWLRRGVPAQQVESVAEHSFGVAVLGLWLTEAGFSGLDRLKVLQMALLHDIGEIYAGDLTPADAVPAEEKHLREAASVRQVLGKLPGGEKFVELWQEFEQGATPEARLVRQLDRLEMGLQAAVYASLGFEQMDEFWATARQALDDPLLAVILNEAEKTYG